MSHPAIARVLNATVFWALWPVSYVRLKTTERTRVLVVAGGTHLLAIQPWHTPYKWSLPGGGIRPDEEPEVAAARELYEETSIALEAETFKMIGVSEFRDRGLTFRCRYFVTEAQKSYDIWPHPPEVLRVAWLPLDEIELGSHAINEDISYAISAWRNLVK